MNMKTMIGLALALCAGAGMAAGCPAGKTCGAAGVRTAALEASAWKTSQWLAAADAPVAGDAEKKRQRAADGTSWFVGEVANEGDVKRATWMTTGLGVYELYVNGTRVGRDALKPGYTHVKKTRRSFTYDVTALVKGAKGAKNVFAAEVSAGWWRDKIVNYAGRKSAFRGVLEVVYADGATKRYGTSPETWKAGVAGKVTHAAIFDGEEYDARAACPALGSPAFAAAVASDEFTGEILPSEGGEVCRRCDLALKPVEAYCWKGVAGANDKTGREKVFGQVVKTRTFKPGETLAVAPGETLVIDFGQNCAGVPCFVMNARRDTVLTCLPGEMLNDANGERARGNDGPGGSLYRENLRMPADGMRLVYTFAGTGEERYMPRFTFFGYRYLSLTATDAVTFTCMRSVPVTSITKDMERGRIETGDKAVNQLISNVYWGQLSNYLSVPTDCPQRNERLGWTADTQVFCEAGAFNADTTAFFHKWMRDMVDSRDADGGFPSVAPFAQYGNETFNLGWADAGVIVPWTVWKQFGDTRILAENWDAMAKFVRKVDATRYKYDDRHYTYADWLSYETFETCGNKFGNWGKWKNDPDAKNYREFLAACYWLYDSRLMVQMAGALGKKAEADEFRAAAQRALAYIRATYVEPDGLLLKPMRHLQTACVFALKFGIVQGKAADATKDLLLASIREHGDCLQTGFLGTSFLMDVLTQVGATDVAYTLLLQHKNPSWLYSVDQGATTIWERWNSYVKDTGFGPVGMNSFNHYAYGAVLAWIYKHAAGIAACPCDPGFKTIVMAPKPDRRLGSVKAEYRTPAGGLVTSAWRYEGDKWIWNFTVPAGSTAKVTLPGETEKKVYQPGSYTVVK
ncbi:MAG: family 78 glycoside hydrolase catalytic domain [bacterium]|nr:family 78 glycoside hydrolase catalytic domain [bacterium]